jgi:hypothetical protein
MKALVRLMTSVLVLAAFNLSAATLLVSLESTNPVVPFATWETAATNIQDAVDAATAGDTVLVTNGVYTVGSREISVWRADWDPPDSQSTGLSRVAVTNSIRLESVNGPSVTTIEGGGTNRCVYLGNTAVLSGFTLTNGVAGVFGCGGGLYCRASAVVTNCTVTGNSASRFGGGAYGGTLYNCTLTGNSGGYTGGGAAQCTLYNCVLTNNKTGGI